MRKPHVGEVGGPRDISEIHSAAPGQYPGCFSAAVPSVGAVPSATSVSSEFFATMARLWTVAGSSVAGFAVIGLAVVGLVLVGFGLTLGADTQDKSGDTPALVDATPLEGAVPGTSGDVPAPVESEEERQQPIDDERENDLTLLAASTHSFLSAGEYAFTPGRLVQPRHCVLPSIDKPPRG